MLIHPHESHAFGLGEETRVNKYKKITHAQGEHENSTLLNPCCQPRLETVGAVMWERYAVAQLVSNSVEDSESVCGVRDDGVANSSSMVYIFI